MGGWRVAALQRIVGGVDAGRDAVVALTDTHGLLRQLRALGVGVTLDDVGTGFCSMACLRDLPLDTLKIDRSFVADVHRDARNASICETLLTLGLNLGLQVVAEGVESGAQLQWLRAHWCDQVQGYLLGRPAPLAQVLDALGARCGHSIRSMQCCAPGTGSGSPSQ